MQRFQVLQQPDQGLVEIFVPSAQEKKILKHLLDGLANKEIAHRAGLSEGTTKEYLSRMLEHLQLGSRFELAMWVVTYPELFLARNAGAPAKLHPADCTCAGAYCAVRRAAAEAA